MAAKDTDQPVFVTFASGARLLVRLGIDPDATPEALRYVARTDTRRWPFGDDKPHKYVMAGRVRTMETGVFLNYFREYPRSGRGRDRAPRKRKGEAQ